MKNIWLLFSILCCVACQQQEDKATDLTREIVITGKVENRDVYPNEKELKLTIPFFSKQAKSYTSVIADDGTFAFRFSTHAPLCEVAIRNYAEHLYVRPGDSLHVTIDFKDLLHPQVTGTSAELNKYMTLFTDGGYYRKDYPYDPKAAPKAVIQALKEEYDSRLQRRNDFLKEHSPGKEVEKYTADLLQTDYYVALFGYTYRHSFKNGTLDATYCEKYLAEIDSILTSDDVVFANRFALMQNVGTFLNIKYHAEHKSTPEPDELLYAVNGKDFRQYLYAYFLGTSLFANDTTYIANRRQKFDSIVTNPYLRQNILSLYKEKADYLKNPRNVSDYMLYGHYPDMQPTKNMSFMAPVHQLLAKHKGKVVYISLWGVFCPPCLAEMEPLKKLREHYPPHEVAMVSIGSSLKRDAYEQVLERFSLRGKGIDCIYWTDWMDKEDYMRVQQHWDMHSFPQYLLIDREGVIVDYGSVLRPSYPGTAKRIDGLLK